MTKKNQRPDLNKQEYSHEDFQSVMGYPKIYVDVKNRKVQCPNCGYEGHTHDQCTVPTQEKLFEMLGPKLFDTSPHAIQEKESMIRSQALQKKN